MSVAANQFRSSSRDRKKEAPTGALSTNTTAASSGTQNLVSAEDMDPVDEREIYSDSSDGEELIGGAHGGYVAELTEGQMPIDLEEYISDESTDMSFTACNYRNVRSPPTPPGPAPTRKRVHIVS